MTIREAQEQVEHAYFEAVMASIVRGDATAAYIYTRQLCRCIEHAAF